MITPMRLAVIGKQGQVARALAEAGAAEPDVTVIPLGRPELDLSALNDSKDSWRGGTRYRGKCRRLYGGRSG